MDAKLGEPHQIVNEDGVRYDVPGLYEFYCIQCKVKTMAAIGMGHPPTCGREACNVKL